MRKSKFAESQIVGILGYGEAGLPVAELCIKHGISKTRCMLGWTPPVSFDEGLQHVALKDLANEATI